MKFEIVNYQNSESAKKIQASLATEQSGDLLEIRLNGILIASIGSLGRLELNGVPASDREKLENLGIKFRGTIIAAG